MSSAGISFGGLASGLDTQAIISALVAVEQRPITQLETKKTALGKQKSLFGDLKGLLDKLSSAAKSLKTKSDFLTMKAASDNEDVITASASSSATPGTHTISVVKLAQARVIASSGSAAPDTSLGGVASFEIDIGGNQHLLSVANPTLQSIAATINDAGIGVRADVVDTNNPDASKRYQLVVRAEEPGTKNTFSLSYDDGSPAFQSLIADLNAPAQQLTAASDAELRVDGGVTIYRSANTVSDVIAGVTLDLKSLSKSTGPNTYEAVTVTVSTDAEATSKDVQAFVDAYNKVVDFFSDQGALDSAGKAKSPLFGDSTLRSMRSSLRTILGGIVTTTGNDAYQLMSQIGITSDTAGRLTFNASKFEQGLAADETAVAAVFADSANGIAGRLITQIDVYTDSTDGLIKARNDGYDRQVQQTQRRIDDAETRLENYRKSLQTKYANLESLLTKLQSQGSAFGASQK